MKLQLPCPNCGSPRVVQVLGFEGEIGEFTIRGSGRHPDEWKEMRVVLEVGGIDRECEVSGWRKHWHMDRGKESYDIIFRVLYDDLGLSDGN